MIKFNAINKRTKFKNLCKNKTHEKNKIMIRKKMKYENIDKKNVE